MKSSFARLLLGVTMSFGFVVVSSLPSQHSHPHHRQESFLERVQGKDGRIPHAWSPDAVAPKHARDLRTTALGLLGCLGDGSTMRSGPTKAAVKKAVIWLLAQRDAGGRLAFREDRDWILDHAIATYALVEAGRLSAYKLMHKRLQAPLRTIVRHLDATAASERPSLDAESKLWFALIARSAAKYEAWWREQGAAKESWSELPKALAKRLAKIAAVAPQSERARAAAALEASITKPKDEAASRTIAELAAAWPEKKTRDLLAVLYVAIALHRLAANEDEVFAASRKAFRAHLERTIVKTWQVRVGPLQGS